MNANQTEITFRQAYNDAGYLREYIARRFGNILIHGGMGDTYFRAMKLVKRIAGLTGLTQKQILKQVKTDVAHLELEN